MSNWVKAVVSLSLAVGVNTAAGGAASETAKADAARKKPLQRCDQLNQQAELDCLHKARERIVEAREKREKSATERKEAPEPAKPAATAETPAKKK